MEKKEKLPKEEFDWNAHSIDECYDKLIEEEVDKIAERIKIGIGAAGVTAVVLGTNAIYQGILGKSLFADALTAYTGDGLAKNLEATVSDFKQLYSGMIAKVNEHPEAAQILSTTMSNIGKVFEQSKDFFESKYNIAIKKLAIKIERLNSKKNDEKYMKKLEELRTNPEAPQGSEKTPEEQFRAGLEAKVNHNTPEIQQIINGEVIKENPEEQLEVV